MKNFLISFVALALVGCSHGPVEQPATIAPDKMEPSAKDTAGFLAEMRQKSGGDISKLSPDELAKVNALTRGNAKYALKPSPSR